MSALWLLARPRGLPWVLLLPVVGYGFAHWDGALDARALPQLAVAVVAWALLHCGTMWLNAALDRDDGEILFGRAVAVPPSAARWGYVALAASVVTSALGGWPLWLTTATAALLSVGYSHPRTAWKAHGGRGLAVNVVGYGVLSPLAGFVVVGVAPSARLVLTLAILSAFMASFFFAAQSFQEHDDRSRGYDTLVARRGFAPVVRAARVAFGLGALGVVALALAGWYPTATAAALIPALWVDAWLRRWLHTRAATERAARHFAWRALAYGIVLLSLATVDHLQALRGEGPVAGRATRAGHL